MLVLWDPLSLLLSTHFRGMLWQLSFTERWSSLRSPLPLVLYRSSSHSYLDCCRYSGKPYCSITSLWLLPWVLALVAKQGMCILLFFALCSGHQQFCRLDSSVWASLISWRMNPLNYHQTSPITPQSDFPSQIHSMFHAHFHSICLSPPVPEFLDLWCYIVTEPLHVCKGFSFYQNLSMSEFTKLIIVADRYFEHHWWSCRIANSSL